MWGSVSSHTLKICALCCLYVIFLHYLQSKNQLLDNDSIVISHYAADKKQTETQTSRLQTPCSPISPSYDSSALTRAKLSFSTLPESTTVFRKAGVQFKWKFLWVGNVWPLTPLPQLLPFPRDLPAGFIYQFWVRDLHTHEVKGPQKQRLMHLKTTVPNGNFHQ